MKEQISYEDSEIKNPPPLADFEFQKLKNESIKKLEKSQIDKQTRAEAGITEIPKEPESIPKELPKLIFKAGSKIIKCEKMLLEEEDARILAKHLSILVGSVSSKWYSLAIILIIIISKVSECWDGLSRMLKRKKSDKTEEEQGEMKEQGRPDVI